MGVNGIYGLSGSGLDIESLVKVGMISKQNQLNKMQQTETTNTWLKEEWATIYDKYKDFQNTVSTFKMQSNMNAMKASTSDSSVVTATANGAAAAMNHSVQVSQIATNAYMMTDNGKTVDRATADTSKANSTYLRDVLFKSFTNTGTAIVDGKETNTYTITNEDGTTKNVNGSDTAISITFNDGENSGTVSYTYAQLIEDDKSLSDFASAISSSGVSLQGNYDTVNDTFAIYAKNSGSKSIIGISANNNTGADLLNRLNLAAYDGNTESLSAIGTFSVGASSMATTGMTQENLNDYTTLGFKVKEMDSTDITNYNKYIEDNNLTVEKLKTDGSKKYYMTYTSEDVDTGTGVSTPDISTATVVEGTDEAFAFDVSDGDKTTINIKYTYKDIADGNATMQNIADTISAGITSAGSKTKLTSSYNSATHELTLGSTGGSVSIKARDEASATFLNKAGFKDDKGAAKTFTAGSSTGTTGYSLAGVDAKVKVDGREYTLDSNTKTIAGVTYNFKSVTSGVSASVSVTQDTDKIIEHVSNFVDSYNELLDYINGKLSETKYTDYKPLTSTQEEQMSEEQVKKWTEKAKSGLLYHNSTLQSMVSDMREAVYTPVSGVDSKYNTASSIGISSSTVKGHLTLDVDKLQKALAEDPDCVYQLFASDQDSTYISGSTNKNKITASQQKLDYQGTGLANRLYNAMGTFKEKVEELAGTSKETDDQSYLGKLITSLQTKMSTFKTQMNAFETALYKKYDNMESALSKLGAQLNYVSNYGS